MGSIRLLDCTLRDGGYLNDWNFGKENILYLFRRLVHSNVDVIEVGFLDDRRLFDQERTINPDTESYDKIFAGVDRGNAMVVGMIDFGTCKIENIKPCSESYLDGIRVIFKKDKMYPAMAFCKQLKALGYQVFSQLVSVTSYTDDELREVVELVNDCHPFAMSMVDTYGLCDAPTLSHIIEVIDANLDEDICLGYHAHNNFQLGYANAVSVLNHKLKRDVLVDGTLYGMGKSAGNAPLELLAMYMNLNFGKNYNMEQIQEAIYTCILNLNKKYNWGYNLYYFIAALNRCHPDYVGYLMNKQTLSITSINEILQQIPEEDKLGKNKALLEQLYLNHMEKDCKDAKGEERLKKKLVGKEIFLLGPGTSVQKECSKIASFIQEKHPVTIAINYIPEVFKIDYLFVSNAHRYLQMSDKLTDMTSRPAIVATSNVTSCEGQFDFIFNYGDFRDEKAEVSDNSLFMLLRILMHLGVKRVSLAGFDGYVPDDINYFDRTMEYSAVKAKAMQLNQYGMEFFHSNEKELKAQFVTRSRYELQ